MAWGHATLSRADDQFMLRLLLTLLLLIGSCFGEDMCSINCDVTLPSQFNNTRAFSCLEKLKVTHPNRHANRIYNADASRVKIVHGVTLIGEPVLYGFHIASLQLDSLNLVGLLCPGCAKYHIIITYIKESPIADNKNINDKKVIKKLYSSHKAIKKLIDKADKLSGGEATSSVLMKNMWEYPAMSYIHSMASKHMNRKSHTGQKTYKEAEPIYLYFHNKGCSHIDELHSPTFEYPMSAKGMVVNGFGRRTLYEMALFHEVIAPWRQILEIFDRYGSQIQHAGIAPGIATIARGDFKLVQPSTGGFEFYNFWWARPSYLASRVTPLNPIKNPDLDRHYFEIWLGEANATYPVTSQGVSFKDQGCPRAFNLYDCARGICGDNTFAEDHIIPDMIQLLSKVSEKFQKHMEVTDS